VTRTGTSAGAAEPARRIASRPWECAALLNKADASVVSRRLKGRLGIEWSSLGPSLAVGDSTRFEMHVIVAITEGSVQSYSSTPGEIRHGLLRESDVKE
jgi:hypothetical protein